MGIDERDIRRTTADVHLQLDGPKPGYAPTASGPVRYRRVAWSGSGDAIGYLWYSDADNAAGYVPEAAAGDDAFNAGTFWYRRFAEVGEQFSPSVAVAEFEETGVGSKGAGWIVPDSESEASSVQELNLSAGLSPSGTVPSRQRGESRGRGGDHTSSASQGKPPSHCPQGSSTGRMRGVSYRTDVSGPVQYLPVELGGEVIGYLYTAARGRGASYIRRLSAQTTESGFGGAVVWSERLQEAYADGLLAEDAFRRWIGAPEHPMAGAIPSGAEFAELGSYEELRQHANPGYVDKPLFEVPQSTLTDGTPADRGAPGGWGPMGPVRSEYPEGYRLVSDGPVRYLPAYQGNTLLGYVWAAESDDAAGFAERKLPGGKGAQALTAWVRRFEECKSEGLSPLQGLRRWKGSAEHPVAGRIPTDAEERTAADSDDVELRLRD